MYFDSRKQMKQEFKACNFKIDMTADLPDWDLSTMWFEEQENSMLDNYSQLQDDLNSQPRLIAVCYNSLVTPDQQLGDALHTRQQTVFIHNKHVNSKDHHSILTIKSSKHSVHIGPATLVKNWGISMSAAK